MTIGILSVLFPITYSIEEYLVNHIILFYEHVKIFMFKKGKMYEK